MYLTSKDVKHLNCIPSTLEVNKLPVWISWKKENLNFAKISLK